MKSTLIGRALFVAAASLTFGSVSAQVHPQYKIDTNGDGIVDFNEMQAKHPDLTPKEFAKMDTNSDGQLARDELSAAHFEKRIKLVDKDGDGAISMDEMEEFHRRPHAERFKRFDADDDGRLTRQELEAMHEEMRQHGPALMKFRRERPAAEDQSE